MEQLLVGIDLGTTGAKTSIYTTRGQLRATAYEEYICTFPRPGWIEQDVTAVIEASYRTCKAAVSSLGTDKELIAGVSFSTQRTCTIFCDTQGELVRPMISWQDNRPIAEYEMIRKDIGAQRFQAITGLPLNTTWNISKILWLRDHEQENFDKVAMISQLQGYALKAYGAETFYVDKAVVGVYGLYDIRSSCWDDSLLSYCGITPDMLPKVVASGTIAGSINSKVAELSGLPVGTPLCVGAGDQNSAIVGAGVVKEGLVSISLGTGGLAGAYLDRLPDTLSATSILMNHAIDGAWELEGYQAGAASVLRWVRDEITQLEHSYATSSGKKVYALLDELARKAPAGSKGLLMLPYFASACHPRWNPHARGAFIGLSFSHDRSCMVRSCIEGITLEVKDMLTDMEANGLRARSIRILGGPTASTLWNQIQASVYGRPVETLEDPNAAILGAAIIAGVGVGIFPDITTAVSSMVHVKTVYEPDPKETEIYQQMYGLYCDTYEAFDSSGLFPKFTEIQDRIH